MTRLSTRNFRSPAALARFFLTTLVGLALDLWTKHWAFAELATGNARRTVIRDDGSMATFVEVMSDGPYRFIPGWLHFNVTLNQGAVFGIGQGQRWLFLTVSVAAIVFLTYLFTTSGRQKFYQFLLGMLLAGVLGNMYDRIVYGYVRDMIHALPGWRNPLPWLYNSPEIFPWIFNVADCLLCVGVFLLIVYSFVHRPRPQEVEGGFPIEPQRQRDGA